MKKILLLGFEPFGSYRFDPSQDLVQRFDDTMVGNTRVIGGILPCSYKRVSLTAINLYAEHKPDAILAVGLASRVPVITIETRGRNLMDSHYADADSVTYTQKEIVPLGDDYLYTTANNGKLSHDLKMYGVRHQMSGDAEGFVCNKLIYNLSAMFHLQEKFTQFAFIHTPWTDCYRHRIELESYKQTISEVELDGAVSILIESLTE